MNIQQLTITGIILFCLGLFVLLLAFWRKLAQSSAKRVSVRFRPTKRLALLSTIVLGVAFVTAGQLFLWLNSQHKQFSIVESGATVAQVSIQNSGRELLMVKVPVTETNRHSDSRTSFATYTFALIRQNSGTCQINAEVIDWDNFFSFLGLRKFFRIARIDFNPVGTDSPDSSNPQTASESSQPQAFSLSEEADEFVELLQSLPGFLRFVQVRKMTTATFPLNTRLAYRIILQQDQLILQSISVTTQIGN